MTSNEPADTGKADAPASESQRVEASPTVHVGTPTDESQRDSPPLPQSTINLMNDGILDQQSRRSHRPLVVWLSVLVLSCFMFNLTSVVWSMNRAFIRALDPDVVAKGAAAHLARHVNESSALLGPKDASRTPSPTAESKSARAVPAPQELKIEAKIYGEIRDSMVPLVALVSILTVAIVVILGTFLKAAFLGHTNGHSETKTADSSPVPLIEALKSVVESIKALFKN